jgi:methylated-DNA-[protein]-cysteine S-methyltransferase
MRLVVQCHPVVEISSCRQPDEEIMATIHSLDLPSPLGWLRVSAHETCIWSVCFLPEDLKPELVTLPSTKLLAQAASELAAYFHGIRAAFTLPLAYNGTLFQCRVWREAEKIPYGCTISYKELAEKIDKPGACRAVGQALHRNPLPLFVPCHRIIGASGKLTGFAGGLRRKQVLLEHEFRHRRSDPVTS